ncbi:MAG: hypothetical protein E6590_17900 [Clostridiales bacterium]|nr:hypothetical protein [Clostridiales bacterium]
MSNVIKNLNDLQKKLNSASGNVSFGELFNQNFMQEYTNFNTIGELFKNGGFEISTQEDLENIPLDEFNAYLRTVSKFSDWNQMKQQAGILYLKRKLSM